MDKTKLAVLRDINYAFPQTCGMCRFGAFTGFANGQPRLWGTCSFHQYKHETHTGEPRQLSIHLFGGCDAFQVRLDMEPSLHGFSEFLP